MDQEKRNFYIEAFKQYSTGAICDAMDKLHVKKR